MEKQNQNKAYEEEDYLIFRKDYKDYDQIDMPYDEYMKQVIPILKKAKGFTDQEALDYIQEMMKKKGTQDPIIYHTYRAKNGDKLSKRSTLSTYIKERREANDIIAPSFTAYTHHDKLLSLHSSFIHNNMKKRSIFKKLMLKNEVLGNTMAALFNANQQLNMKVYNNAMSGSSATNSTAMYNPSTHYTLTSTTRSLSSIANIVSESFISSNKMFNTPDRVLNYIATVVSTLDLSTLQVVMDKYHLYYPKVEEVFDSILYSTRNYFTSYRDEKLIKDLLTTLTPLELAAVLYVNDFKSIRNHNQDFVRKFLTELNQKKRDYTDDPLGAIEQAPEGIANLVHIFFINEIKGKIIVYKELEEDILNPMGSTAKYLIDTFKKYKDFISIFFSSSISPPGVCDFKDMVRECIVLSDTDSTCASYGEWSDWYFKETKIDADAMAIAGIIVTMNCNIIDHFIKILAKNMNIPESHVEYLKMKNEYLWSVFVPTNMSKHYFARVEMREGLVKNGLENSPEIKGIHLLASAANESIRKTAKEMIISINEELKANKGKIKVKRYIDQVVNLELDIIRRIEANDVSFFTTEQIKNKEGYKNPESLTTKYYSHILWNKTFGKVYGFTEEPPYTVYKINLTTETKILFKAWLDSLTNETLKEDIINTLKDLKKDYISLIRIPAIIASKHKIPDEIKAIIDVKSIILDNIRPFYMILESIGIYKNKDECLYETMIQKENENENK